VTDQPSKPVIGINWTNALRDAGIPEPPWDEPQKADAPTPEIQDLEPEDRENWMHV
jgi:hypothetical protein